MGTRAFYLTQIQYGSLLKFQKLGLKFFIHNYIALDW